MVFRLVFLSLMVHFVPSALKANEINTERGSFFFREYSPKTYGAGSQNWAVVQDRKGVVYVGNNEGILEYDGQKWRKLELPNLSAVRSLAVDGQGIVYVGGQSEIGFLQADKTGLLRYVSLLDQIEPKDRVFNDVWTILSTKSGVVFSSNQRLFRWSPNNGMKVWKPSSSFSAAFLVDDAPYVIQQGLGLSTLEGDSLRLVPGGELFSQSLPLRGVLRFGGSIMVATSQSLYIRNDTGFEEFKTEAKELLRESRISACLLAPDGTLVVGTVHRGVILISPQGKILRILNDGAFGWRGNSINSMSVDRDAGLWLALNNGLARVDIAGSVTRFTERDGLQEIVASIQRHDGVLYAGTTAGLLRLAPGKTESAKFQSVPGIHGQVVALKSTSHGLLIAAPGGLYELTKSGVQELSPHGGVNDLALSASDPSTAYVAGRSGLFVLHLDKGQWQQRFHIDSGGKDLLSVAEGPDGRVWATALAEVWRFDLSSNPVAIERFVRQQGVPAGGAYASRVRRSALFVSAQGLLRFDSNTHRFVAETAFGKEFANGSRPVSLVAESPDGDIWISGKGYHCALRPTNAGGYAPSAGGYAASESILGNYGIRELSAVYVDSDGTVWAAGMDGGLVRREQSTPSRESTVFDAVLRQARIVGREEIVFGGADAHAITPNLPYRENALHLDFAAPHFEDASEIEFRVFLEGLSRNWSPWTTESEKEYTNLWEGNYVFHVQARDLKGRVSRESTFAFRVLPPVYREPWAYFLYLVLAFSSMWLIVKWRLLNIKAQNRKLERIVDERTGEIRQQRDEIRAHEQTTERLLLNILPAPVAQELRTTGVVTPLTCGEITVCFTDFVGFTLASEEMPAPELVTTLNRYFTEFDRIVDHYHLEKIKTIGDSYMFVSGLPQAKASHAVDAVLAALEIIDAVERLADSPDGWKIRVGLHSGPVVAGVVGLRKFAFDIWGKTVNFASRHESSGQPNRVNVSAQTRALIDEFFQCEPRGPVLIKGGRALEMYLVRGLRPDLCFTAPASDASLFDRLYQERFGARPPWNCAFSSLVSTKIPS